MPIMITVLLILGMTACGSNGGNTSAEASVSSDSVSSGSEAAADGAAVAEEGSSAESGKESPEQGSGTLVVYFSATGTTKGVTEKIAGISGADIYEIKAAQEYTEADLDWNDSDSRTTHEQDDPSVRPEIGSDTISLDGYDTIYIGYPIWWGEEPRIMDTFVESYDFDGITMIPFCTSGGSGIGISGKNLEENAGSGNWLDGERLQGSISEDELRSWMEGLQ